MSESWSSNHSAVGGLEAALTQEQAARIAGWRKAITAQVPDARDQVGRAVKKWNQAIRDQLRDEMGFRLSTKYQHVSVPVTVAEGLPIALLDVLGPANTAMEELQRRRALFESTYEGLSVLQGLLPQVIEVIRNAAPTTQDCETVARALRLLSDLGEALGGQELPARILALRQDVLGSYTWESPEATVYWMPIAILAVSANISIEALAFVVLAHELAHAYTHLGHDINGNDWDTGDFARADLELVEGLAQYYTESVCNKLTDRFPAALECFEIMLKRQPPIYTNYRDWNSAKSGESMREYLREVSQRIRPAPDVEQFV